MKRLVLLFGLLLAFGTGSSYAQWTELPQIPILMNWPMTAQINGTIYVFGGVDATASNAVYTYTPGDAAWKKLSVVMPKAKFAGYAGVANGKIYIVGGMVLSGTSFIADNTTYEFDPTASTFATKKTIPVKVGFFAGATVGGKIYVINGSTVAFSGPDVNKVQIYDPTADSWSTAASTPDFSNRLAASAVLNGNIYVMGGLKDSAANYSDEVWKGIPTGTGDVTWTQVNSLPDALMQVSGGAAGGKLVFTGGYNNNPPIGYSNTYVYDPAADAWTTSYALPVATFNGGQLVGTGNDLYFVGGNGNNTPYKFTVSSAQVAYAVLPITPPFVNLAPNQSRVISFSATNYGVIPLSVNVTVPDSAKAWLSAQSNLSIDPLGSDTYSLTFTSGTLAPGLYKATVTVTTNDATHASIPVAVKLYVLPSTIKTQPTVAVLEEGTGNWCGWCPEGKEVVDQCKQQFGDSFIGLAYHGGSSTEPMMVTAGQNLINDLKIQGYPNAAIERWFFPGEPYQMTNRGVWQQYVQNVLDQQPDAPVSINVTSYSFDQTTKKVHAVVELQRSHAMTNDPNTSIRLTTVVTEDGLAGQQEDYRTPSPYWIDFIWDDIVRQVYPNEFGTKAAFPTPTLTGGDVIVPGDIVDMTVDLTVPNTINKDSLKNCNITFIANLVQGTSTLANLLQAQKRPLMGSTDAVNSGIATNFSLDQNYPNPVSNQTKISYSIVERSPVTLTVHDVLGRNVAQLVSTTQDAGNYNVNFDASKLSAGTYIYTLNAGGQTLEKTMTVTK